MMDIFVVPDIWNMLAQWGATLILFLVIRHFIYKPMNEFLEKRKTRVMEDLTEAETKKKEAIAMKEEYERQLAEAKKQGQEIVEESRKRGALLEHEHVAEGKNKAEALLEKARVQIERERQMASEEIRDETADMAVLIAEKILGESIDTSHQDKLVDGFIQDLEKNHVR
ncbi:F0F1 ATP synthase subunit B [Peptoniphilus sp. KCTC 25270]|uniref:F0F1 ATP synthase subunit B n=1 Tax=Peptoniphilus sp. KCTC 25270 TaxID=2897414 RepID=UPI001E2ACD87|nr:F0F1 ATP synthase subunit B [Peptoniphilus sp. KCTC 25270]MCD1147580.1 F0F1 ATP synthase subunit B [Peptoniphilus sp. KCTC 25270]